MLIRHTSKVKIQALTILQKKEGLLSRALVAWTRTAIEINRRPGLMMI
jgi:hypothetical protein